VAQGSRDGIATGSTPAALAGGAGEAEAGTARSAAADALARADWTEAPYCWSGPFMAACRVLTPQNVRTAVPPTTAGSCHINFFIFQP
jgi:hypothetical protein